MNRCTTERVMDGLRETITAKLMDRYGPLRKAWREHEYPEAFDPRQTPAVGLLQGPQTSILGDCELEQEVTLQIKVMANEFTGAGEVGGPRIIPLLNEVFALLDEIFVDDQPLLNGVVVTYLTENKQRIPEPGDQEVYATYPLALRYARLAANQIGEE